MHYTLVPMGWHDGPKGSDTNKKENRTEKEKQYCFLFQVAFPLSIIGIHHKICIVMCMHVFKNIFLKIPYEKLHSPPTTIVSATILDRQEHHA